MPPIEATESKTLIMRKKKAEKKRMETKWTEHRHLRLEFVGQLFDEAFKGQPDAAEFRDDLVSELAVMSRTLRDDGREEERAEDLIKTELRLQAEALRSNA